MANDKRISTFDEVERFLSELFGKMTIREIFFLDDRQKNMEALVQLNIPRGKRTEIIRSLEVKDYSEGPIIDAINLLGEMWVFGKDVNGTEVYIKISLGGNNRNVICISFHPAEHPMRYPYKEKES